MTRLEALRALKEAVEVGETVIGDKAALAFDPANYARVCRAYGEGKAAASLDAARALHEAVLLGYYAGLHIWPMPEMSRVDIGGGHTGRDDCPARAWLLAILSALIAQEQDK